MDNFTDSFYGAAIGLLKFILFAAILVGVVMAFGGDQQAQLSGIGLMIGAGLFYIILLLESALDEDEP